MIMYIYQIRNVINNKKYYGKTKDINKRKKRHFRDLDHNSHHCIYLQRAYNEYGKDNFVFEILFENLTEEEAERKEYELINEDYNNNYNCSKNSTGGDLISYNPNRDSIIKNISKTLKKRFEEHPELRTEISRKTAGENNPMYGKHHTQEVKNKISKIHKGKHLSDEQKKNISKVQKERFKSQEERDKQRDKILKVRNEHPEVTERIRTTVKEKWNSDNDYVNNVTNGMRRSINSGKNNACTKIFICGKVYNTIKEASISTGLSNYKIRKKLNDENILDYKYISNKKVVSEEQRKKLSEVHKKSFYKNHSKETKNKISLSNQIYKYDVHFPNGEIKTFVLRKELYCFFKQTYNISNHTIYNLAQTGEPWHPKKYSHKILDGMYILKIKKGE